MENHGDSANGDEPGYTRHQGKLLMLNTKIDIESRLTIGCAGALIAYLQRRKAVGYLPGDLEANLAFRISVIAAFSLSGIV